MFLQEFICPDGHRTEELLAKRGDSPENPCTCGKPKEPALSAPWTSVLHDPARRAEILKKRSADHSLRELRKHGLPERSSRNARLL